MLAWRHLTALLTAIFLIPPLNRRQSAGKPPTKCRETADKVPGNRRQSAGKPPTKCRETADRVPDTANKVPDMTEKLPDNEQEQQIYKYVLEKGAITTAQTVEILDVKHRRARAILLNMVTSGYLKREGAARSTIYVKNMEER